MNAEGERNYYLGDRTALIPGSFNCQGFISGYTLPGETQ